MSHRPTDTSDVTNPRRDPGASRSPRPERAVHGEEVELPEEHVSRLEPCIRRRFAVSTPGVEEHLYKAVPWCTEEGHEAVVYVYDNEMPSEGEVEGYIRDGVPIVEFGKYDI